VIKVIAVAVIEAAVVIEKDTAYKLENDQYNNEVDYAAKITAFSVPT
jgi:hypothetical protein